MSAETPLFTTTLDCQQGILQLSHPTTPFGDRAIAETGRIWHGRLADMHLDALAQQTVTPIYEHTGMFVTPHPDELAIPEDRVLSYRKNDTPVAFTFSGTSADSGKFVNVFTKNADSSVRVQVYTKSPSGWMANEPQNYPSDILDFTDFPEARAVFDTMDTLEFAVFASAAAEITTP